MTRTAAIAAGFLALVGCGGDSNDTTPAEVQRVEFPADDVTCFVYNSHDDSGSGISCVPSGGGTG